MLMKLSQRLWARFFSKQAAPCEFIHWLRFANPGMLDPGNIYCFEYAIEHLPSDHPVIEIGSFCGLSTNLIGFYLQKNKRKNHLITSDKWIFEGAECPESPLEGTSITHSDYRDFVRESYIRNISFFSRGHLPYTLEVFSDDFFARWAARRRETDVLGREIQLGGPISFAYIDGNHSYEYAKRDFKNVDAFLEPGGFILFDDSADGSDWGVCRVIDALKHDRRYEIVAANPNYLVRKRR